MVPEERFKEYHGLVLYDETSALIKLATGADDSSTIETLIEEWAHILRDECPMEQRGDHDELFWAIYARIICDKRGE